MPTYEYECDKCGKHFEYFQSMKDAPKTDCEACGGSLTKLLSAGSGLIFKGSGFYITDYKSNGSSGGSKSESAGSSSAGDSGSGAAAKTDTAAAAPAKPDSK